MISIGVSVVASVGLEVAVVYSLLLGLSEMVLSVR